MPRTGCPALRWRLLGSIAAGAVALLAAQHASGGDTQWTIVDTFAIPEGASGLAFDGTWLYCGIYGPDGGRVYQIDPADGSYTLLFTGPHEDAYGLTFDGEHLWTTDHPGSPSSPAVAVRLDWSGNLIDQLDLPAHYVSGIAWDAGDFWTSRYYPDPGHVYKLDAAGTILDEFDGPDDQPWDLCVENENLWVADYWGDTLYKLDAATGAMLESHPSEGVDPAGIVWDGQHLWYCDNGEGGNDFLYKVDLQGGGTPQIELPETDHDYGVVPIGEMATWNVTVQNTGNAPLEIAAVDLAGHADLSCPVAFPLTIPAGMSDVLPVVFAPSSFGALDVTATIESNDPVHPTEALALTGDGVYPDATIDLAADAHDYGAVRLDAHTRWHLEIRNHGNQTLTVTDLSVDDSRFYVDGMTALPLELTPLATAQVGIWFSPDAVAAFAGTLTITSTDAGSPTTVTLTGSGEDVEHPMGQTLWTYTIDTSFDNSPKAMASIPDVSGDTVADVIVCSEDDYVRCFNGNSDGTADVLWEHEIFAGAVFSQSGLQIIEDIDEDGYHDVVVGSAWGGRLVRALSGRTGEAIWTYDTDEYGSGGWVYQVDCSKDFNDDGTVDVLAATGDDASDTGPKRAFCLNGLTGVPIWERPLGGPVFAVIGVEDFTGDGHPDVVAGASNEDETQGRAVGVDGSDGTVAWNFFVDGSSVWALAQLGDITGDGVKDVLVGDFLTGNVHGVDATTGFEEYASGGLGVLTRFERLDDVDGDDHPDFVPTHSGDFARVISGLTGAAAWTTPLADNASTAARIADVSGDGVNDVVVGTLFTSNRTYFLDGVHGGVLQSAAYPTPVDAITAIPDITGDGSWEMVAGGRNGLVTCISGG
ncbi:MAG: choice-of-anchor D domain-containing protein, partial [Planctomycetota bacterium]